MVSKARLISSQKHRTEPMVTPVAVTNVFKYVHLFQEKGSVIGPWAIYKTVF